MKPFEAFAAAPTPSNAVALAIDDHRAGPLTDWTFVEQLRKAQEQVNAYPKLIAALRFVVTHDAPMNPLNPTDNARDLLRELGEMS